MDKGQQTCERLTVDQSLFFAGEEARKRERGKRKIWAQTSKSAVVDPARMTLFLSSPGPHEQHMLSVVVVPDPRPNNSLLLSAPIPPVLWAVDLVDIVEVRLGRVRPP